MSLQDIVTPPRRPHSPLRDLDRSTANHQVGSHAAFYQIPSTEGSMSSECPSLANMTSTTNQSSPVAPVTPLTNTKLPHSAAEGLPTANVKIQPVATATIASNGVFPEASPALSAPVVDQTSPAIQSTSASSSSFSTAGSSRRMSSPAEQLFTDTGRPARRAASSKTITYAPGCDKNGNPIKTDKEKLREKQEAHDRKQRHSDCHNQKKETVVSTASASSNSGAKDETGRSASAVSASNENKTRSGRTVTKPLDAHRSSDREAKRWAREREKQQRQKSLAVESDDEDEEETEDEGPARENDDRNAISNPRAYERAESKQQTKRKVPEEAKDELDLLSMSDEGESHRDNLKPPDATTPTNDRSKSPLNDASSKKRRKPDHTSAKDSIASADVDDSPDNQSRKGIARQDYSENAHHPRDSTSDAIEVGRELGVKEQREEEQEGNQAEARAAQRTSGNDEASRANVIRNKVESNEEGEGSRAEKSRRDSNKADTPNAESSPDVDAMRKSFSGRSLSALLGSSSHRRPGLTRKNFVPPLHPNRKPAPPPRPPPPMSRKDQDALKKLQKQREEDGSDVEDDADDSEDEGKRGFDPFEEEIEGY